MFVIQILCTYITNIISITVLISYLIHTILVMKKWHFRKNNQLLTTLLRRKYEYE